MDDLFFIPGQRCRVEIKIKASKFIGQIFEVGTTMLAGEILAKIKKEEHTANHNCFAYRIGFSKQPDFKYSDDGEPSQTAGRPIYDIIQGNNLTNCLIVVTRYFGGTKLGTGGLVRAYSDCAREAIEKSTIKEFFITETLKIKTEFRFYNQIQIIAEKMGAKQVASDFSDIVKVEYEIRKSKKEEFLKALINVSDGKAEIE